MAAKPFSTHRPHEHLSYHVVVNAPQAKSRFAATCTQGATMLQAQHSTSGDGGAFPVAWWQVVATYPCGTCLRCRPRSRPALKMATARVAKGAKHEI
jgi:hypothetical protein